MKEGIFLNDIWKRALSDCYNETAVRGGCVFGFGNAVTNKEVLKQEGSSLQ